MEVRTTSAQDTQNLGQKIATDLLKESRGKTAKIVTLTGELGSGKTTFTQGFAKGLGIPHRVLSPTFIISREYPLTHKNFTRFYHIDLYRMENKADLEGLGLAEIFTNPDHIVVIEWAKRLGDAIPENYLDIAFTVLDDDKRQLQIKNISNL